MSGSPRAERLALFSARGGWAASLYWLVRRAFRLDLFKVLSIDLSTQSGLQAVGPLPTGVSLLALSSQNELSNCDPALRAALDDNSGWGVGPVIAAGGRVYAIVRGSDVLCQLNIDLQRSRINTPCDMWLDLPEREGFLSFLHTAAGQRRRGWAGLLLAHASHALAGDGMLRCHCHVQATNLRSLNAFADAGWRRAGWIAATPSKRYLFSNMPSGLQVRLPAAAC